MNTYLKMLKEDVSRYDPMVQEYQQKVYERYMERLLAQSRKRINQKNPEDSDPD